MYNTSQAGPHTSTRGPQRNPSVAPKHPNNNHTCKLHETSLPTGTFGPNQSVGDKPDSTLQSSEPTASEQAKTGEGDAAGHPTPTPSGQQASATAGAADDSIELASVVLPRMPLGLKHITMPIAYTAVANVARALGKCSAAAGCERHTHSGWLLSS